MKIKVIAIPFAGGNTYSYSFINKFLPANITFETFELPGRGERISERLITNAQELAKDTFHNTKEEIREGPYIIYGHSLGALIGYEFAKEIVRRDYPLPKNLFFTGMPGPSVKEEDRISEYPSIAMWEELNRRGGLPPVVFSNMDLREFFEPIIRADLKVIESYAYRPLDVPLPIPITVIGGSEDEDVSEEELDTWQKETSLPLNKSFMSGNHFFILEHASAIVQQMLQDSSPTY